MGAVLRNFPFNFEAVGRVAWFNLYSGSTIKIGSLPKGLPFLRRRPFSTTFVAGFN